jgi:hypothetical protein
MHNRGKRTFRLAVALPVTLAIAAGTGVSATLAVAPAHPAFAAGLGTAARSYAGAVSPAGPRGAGTESAAALRGMVVARGAAALRRAIVAQGADIGRGAAVASLLSFLGSPAGRLPDAGAAGHAIGRKWLKAVLLAQADLPDGYKRVGRPTVMKGNLLGMLSGTGTTPPATTRCDATIDLNAVLDPSKPAPTLQPGLTATATFSKSDEGPIVSELLSSGRTANGSVLVAAVAGELRQCPTITIRVKGSDGTIVITNTPLAAPQIGDASVAATFAVKLNGEPEELAFQMAVFTKGRVTGTVILTGPGKKLDGFADIAQATDSKLQHFA